MSEAQVLGLLDASNAADSALGSLGATKGATREIKDFGLMITREHHALRREVQQMAGNLRLDVVPPSVALDVAPADAREAVDSAPPNAWEQQYLALAVAQHDASMENLARALAATKSPAVKRYIERAAPIIQKHLDRAKRLQETANRAQPRKP